MALLTLLFTYSPQALVFMVNATGMLYDWLTNKLKTCTTHCVDVLKASISLVLFAVAQLKAFCPSDEKYQKDEAIEEAFSSLKSILSGWIVDRAVIGGSLFGGSLSAASWKSTSKEELKVIKNATVQTQRTQKLISSSIA